MSYQDTENKHFIVHSQINKIKKYKSNAKFVHHAFLTNKINVKVTNSHTYFNATNVKDKQCGVKHDFFETDIPINNNLSFWSPFVLNNAYTVNILIHSQNLHFRGQGETTLQGHNTQIKATQRSGVRFAHLIVEVFSFILPVSNTCTSTFHHDFSLPLRYILPIT